MTVLEKERQLDDSIGTKTGGANTNLALMDLLDYRQYMKKL